MPTGAGRRRPSGREGDERAAGLTGGGPSVLGVTGSMRTRDVSRPTVADEVAAERLVQVSYRPRSHPRPPLGTPQRPAPQRPPDSGGSSPDAS